MSRSLCGLYPALERIPAELRAEVEERCPALEIPSGHVIFDEHQPCTGFAFVLAGAVRVIKLSPTGRELPLYRVLPGESCVITSSCLLAGADYNARGVAEGATKLALMPTDLFARMMDKPAFRDFVFHLFAERLAEMMQLVEEVAFRKLDQRLANRLLGHGALLHVTHQQLADELGSVREIVSRLLKSFATQGLVRLGREQIEILDAQGLRDVAGAV